MNWSLRLAILFLWVLVIILHIRVFKLERRVNYLTEELIQTKRDVLATDVELGHFMKNSNEIFGYIRQAINALAGAR